MRTYTTDEIAEVLANNSKKYIEVRLLLHGGYATHFLFYNSRQLLDEGVDGETRRISLDTLKNNYTGCFWIIDQIV